MKSMFLDSKNAETYRMSESSKTLINKILKMNNGGGDSIDDSFHFSKKEGIQNNVYTKLILPICTLIFFCR